MTQPPRIWIDLDNAPHAHFFAPLVHDLSLFGYEPVITLRAFGQTEGLAQSYGMNFSTIGTHGAHLSKAGRALETLSRAAQLVTFGIARRPVAALSHGSRSLTIAAAALGIPCMALYDYEHISAGVFHHLCRRVLVPEIVLQACGASSTHACLIGYPGFKEEVYVHHFQPDGGVLEQLALDPARLIVTVRPPATWAHYHNDHSTTLFRALIEHLRTDSEAQVIVLARTAQQAGELTRDFQLDTPPFRLTSDAVDGLSLLCYSDAVFSGGGTMVREAALLGAAAYSTFAGKSGAVDRELERLGLLTMLRTPADVAQLHLAKRSRTAAIPGKDRTRNFILHQIVELANQGRPS